MTLDEALESIKPTNVLGKSLEAGGQVYPVGSITLFQNVDRKNIGGEDRYAGADNPPLNERLLYANENTKESLYLYVFGGQTKYSLGAGVVTNSAHTREKFEKLGLEKGRDIDVPESIQSKYKYIINKHFEKGLRLAVYDMADRLFEEFVQ